MRVIIVAGILLALAVIGANYSGGSNDSTEVEPIQTQNKSVVIFNAIYDRGITIEDAYTSKGIKIKEAFGLEDSIIEDDELIAFIIFRYSDSEGVDTKVVGTIDSIFTAFNAEPSIDGVLVMPYDPEVFEIGGGANMIYSNRSHTEELAQLNLPLRTVYNRFDHYTIISEVE